MSVIAVSQTLVVIKIETQREWDIIDAIPFTHKRRRTDVWQIRAPQHLNIPEIDHALEEEKCQLKMF